MKVFLRMPVVKVFLHAGAIALLWLVAVGAGFGGLYTAFDAIEDGSVLLAAASLAQLFVALLAYLTMYRLIGAYRRQHTDDQLPEELTDTLTFRSNPRKVALFLTFSVAMAAGGLLMLRDGDELIGSFVIAVGLFGVTVFAWTLLPGAAYLQISCDGMTVRSLHRTQHFAWHEVRNFRARDTTSIDDMVQRTIYYDLTSGDHGSLPDSYGLNPQQLALELNRYCERYGSPPVDDPGANADEQGFFPATLSIPNNT